MREQTAWVENAGVENAGVGNGVGKCNKDQSLFIQKYEDNFQEVT